MTYKNILKRSVSVLAASLMLACVEFPHGAFVTHADNDTLATADTVQLNSTVTDSVTKTDIPNWYKFTVEEDGYFSVDLSSQNSSTILLVVYNSAEEKIYSKTMSFKKGADNLLSTGNLGFGTGDYYVGIGYADILSYAEDVNYSVDFNFTADPNYETEPNNLRETADSLPVNGSVSGNILNNNDTDWYKFTIDENGCVRFDFDADFTNESAEWGLELYDSESTSYIYSTRFGGKNNVISSANLGLEQGEYYAKIKYSAYSTGDYKLSLNFEPDVHCESEPNNSAAAADNAELGSYVTGNLLTSNDTDWYKFTVNDKGYTNFSFETAAEGGEWILELFETPESSFSFYKKTFKAGDESNVTADIGLDEGEYYAKIRNSVWRSDDYRLNLNFIPHDKWESEFNSDFDTADEIIPNSTISGCLMSSSDKDYYTFTLEDDGYINLDFISQAVGNSVTYYTMELMDSTENHTVIYTVQIQGNSELVESGNIGLAKGTYFVRIKPNSTFTENYTIMLDYTKSAEWEKEYNNTKETATVFPMNSTMNGNLKKSPDTDYYEFEMTEDGTIFIDFERPSDGKTTVYWVVGIIDESGKYLERYYMKGDEELTSTQGLALTSGNYYMHIQASSFNSSDYEITLRDFDYAVTEENTLYGDANLDGKVSISDAVAILQYISNGDKYPLDERAKINADVDGIGGVTGKDAAEIQKYDAKVIDAFAVEKK